MKNAFLLFLLILMSSITFGELFPEKNQVFLYDHSGVLSAEDKTKLENQLKHYKKEGDIDILLIITKDLIKKQANQFAEKISKTHNTNQKLIILTADVNQNVYGFYASEQVKNKFPLWAQQKIETNYLKRNFREKNYLEGLQQTSEVIFAIASNQMDIAELKKDTSGSYSFLLMGVLVLFLLLFPIIQYHKMKQSHIASKPLDFVNGVLLANRYGIRGKNLFDDFANTRGTFATTEAAINGQAGGIAGSW